MSKSLYSVILTDEVVKEVDREALRQGTSRSNLINQIIAEYVSYRTPEKRAGDIFRAVCGAACGDIVPFVVPGAMTMSLKSSLAYKYRPTVRYEVELYREPGDAVGQLSVIYRSQSASLIDGMNAFFRLWKKLEDAYLPRDEYREYALTDGKFMRSITLHTAREISEQEIGKAVSDYIGAFDTLMKGFLSGEYKVSEIEKRYAAFVADGSARL